MAISRPQADEYAPFYAGYVQRVPEGADVLSVLSQQPDELVALMDTVSDEQSKARPAPGEWSIKEVLGHINDTERVFAYRAVRIARADTTPLPGFDQDTYVQATNFNARSCNYLLQEFNMQRRANLLAFLVLTPEELNRRGTASGNPISVRALLYIMAGHVMHHVESLQVDYHVGG